MVALDWKFVEESLSGGIWHATTDENYNQIVESGVLLCNPSSRIYNNSFSSKNGWLSVFDFRGCALNNVPEHQYGNIIECLQPSSSSVIIDCGLVPDRALILESECHKIWLKSLECKQGASRWIQGVEAALKCNVPIKYLRAAYRVRRGEMVSSVEIAVLPDRRTEP